MARKNLLKGSRAYLSGPIEHTEYRKDHGQEWKSDVTKVLKNFGVKVFDPTSAIGREHEQFRKQIKKVKEQCDYETLRTKMKKIVREDLRAVDLSDFVIVHYPKGCTTTGTNHEVFEADRSFKPVLVCCPQGINGLPDWYYGILPLRYMFDSWAKLHSYLEKVNKGLIEDDRWQFIKFS